MVQRLRSNFVGANKPKIITSAPQCIVPDANMGGMITNTQFDIIWVQYYNTPQCSARNWANANPNYLLTGIEAASGFSYDTWADFIPVQLVLMRSSTSDYQEHQRPRIHPPTFILILLKCRVWSKHTIAKKTLEEL